MSARTPAEERRSCCATAALHERQDTLAYLRRKRANAETMAERSAEFADQGRWAARQIAILEQDISTGLHVGEADKPEPSEWR